MNVRPTASQITDALQPDLGSVLQAALEAAPDAVCLHEGAQRWTRREVLKGMTALKAALDQHRLAPGEPVVVDLPHSFAMVACLGGVLLAGGLAVPLDPELPPERREAILRDVAPRLIVRPDPSRGSGFTIETTTERPQPAPDLAFLVYTSGSSGRPKGVEISHAGYVGRLRRITEANPPQSNDVDLLWTPSGFIGMLDEVFFPLLLGIPCVVAPIEARMDPHLFAKLIADEAVTTFRITPSLLNVFVSASTAKQLSGVRAIFCSGEKLSETVQRKVQQLIPSQLICFYGATEAPGVAYHVCGPASDGPEYTAQDFASIRITDEAGTQVAAGETGEIWIGGIALAKGYWNRPDLSAQKFQHLRGAAWYRTGDLGKWIADGRFEILGRADMSEANILGVRVNLPEICDQLRAQPGVSDAWVSQIAQNGQSDPLLAGHVVGAADAELDVGALRSGLATTLPRAAMPAQIIVHDGFPLTANGKLDIQALAEAARLGPKSNANVAEPKTRVDLSPKAVSILPTILSCAEDVLSQSGLTAHDDFFDLGGNSLQAVEMALLLRERLDIEVSATLVFSVKTIGEIAQAMADEHVLRQGPMRELRKTGDQGPPVITINATQSFRTLAQVLGAPGPIYNLNIFGLTDALISKIDTLSMHDFAAPLAEEIIKTCPEGPLHIMAYCQDGNLAVEIARLLRERSGRSCDLLLIDTFFLHHRPTVKMGLMRLLEFGPGYYARMLSRKLRRKTSARKQTRQTPHQNATLIDKSRNDGRLYRKYLELFLSHAPSFIGGPVTLFISAEWRYANLRDVYDMAGVGLQIKHIPGMHQTLFERDHVHHLAEAADFVLREAS